jgi:hypothetical protein
MAAGLGFKDFVTGEVLTAADVDGYLMQGIWVFASATARDAAVTSPQEGNFAFLKDTNTTTYYTGSAWTNLDTTGMVNPMTTTGDTIYSSSGSTPARLGIGTAGQVLQVNSGATAPEWATPAGGGGGGLTLLSTTTLSGATTTISGISGSYTDLYIIYDKIRLSSAGTLFLQLNGDTGSNYWTFSEELDGSAVNTTRGSRSDIVLGATATSATDNRKTSGYINIRLYTSATSKNLNSQHLSEYSTFGAILNRNMTNYATSSAITSVTFFTASPTFTTGTIYIYGVK